MRSEWALYVSKLLVKIYANRVNKFQMTVNVFLKRQALATTLE